MTEEPSSSDLRTSAAAPPAGVPIAGRTGHAADPLTSQLYDSLKTLARKLLATRAPDQPVDATELVHECYLRLARMDELESLGRAQFLALSSTMIRNILVDLARRAQAAKRGHGWSRITMSEVSSMAGRNELDLIDLDQALQRLSERDELQARIVELHFFGGLTAIEIADLLDIGRKQVHKEWLMARAWLYRELFDA